MTTGMRYRQLGRAGARVSPLAIGTANFGMVTGEDEAYRILDRAHDAGINLVDTADNYNAGISEEIVGRWLDKHPGRRDEVVLATKVYYPPCTYTSPDPVERYGGYAGTNERGLSALHIRQACEASLRRLGTDHIDLYQLHHPDRFTPMEETWQALEVLVAQGKVVYAGTSNFPGWQLARACETARARGFVGPVAEQSPYNLSDRNVERELMPACDAYGVALLAYSPLAGGVLGGTTTGRGRRRHARAGLDTEVRQRVDRFEELCRQVGEDPSVVATAWLATRRAVTTTILGPRTVDQLEAALRSVGVMLDQGTLDQLDDIFPGPPGPAPEPYPGS